MPLFRADIREYQLRDVLWYWAWLPGIVIGSGFLLDWVFEFGGPVFTLPPVVAAIVSLMSGLGFIVRATTDFSRYGDGTPNPKRPPKRLVTAGVYGLCRHPMFLGYDLVVLGIVLLCRSPFMLFASYPLFFIYGYFFLKNEEACLARRYGRAFTSYVAEVPLLIPRLRRRKTPPPRPAGGEL